MIKQFSFDEYNSDSFVPQESVVKETSNKKSEKNNKNSEYIPLDDFNQIIESNNQNNNLNNFNSVSVPYDNQSVGNSYLNLVLSPNLKELELMIRGLEYVKIFDKNSNQERFVLNKIPNHPLNEYGINQIITHLKIYTSPEIKLGRKTQKDYYNAINEVSHSITRLIYKNLKAFGMDTQEKQRNAKLFCLAIIEVLDSSYSRSIGGKENDLSRATDFKIEGRIDSMNDIQNIINPNNRNQLKN